MRDQWLQPKLVVFDLDDTLIDESLWLFQGYAAIAAFAAEGDSGLAERIGMALRDGFLQEGRTGLFERVRMAFPTARGDNRQWLEILRSTEIPGGLPMASWAKEMVGAGGAGRFAILTNGNRDQQIRKYSQLLPADCREKMRLYCAADYAPKPAPDGLQQILADYGCEGKDAVFIGDSEVDAECAARAGVPFIRAFYRDLTFSRP